MRQIKWKIPFKNRQDVDCVINIYEDDYTGDPVIIADTNPSTIGYAGETPFSWEEDDDDDLLSVVRIKTAYIRLIEKEYGSLQPLYPQHNQQHYVTFMRGDVVLFNGFMKAGSYDNDWKAAPREVEFVCVSPLGLLDSKTFAVPPHGSAFPYFSMPSYVTIGSLLYEVVTGMDAAISKVVFPGTDSTPDLTFLDMSIGSTIFVEERDDIFNQEGNFEPYEGRNYADFIETLCNLYGLIVHDTPGALVFSKFNHTGRYHEIDVGDLASGVVTIDHVEDSNTLIDLEAVTEVTSDDNEESYISPLTAVTINNPVTNSGTNESVPFDKCFKSALTRVDYQDFEGAQARCIINSILVEGELINPVINSQGAFTQSGIMMGKLFNMSTQQSREGIYIQFKTGQLFKWTVYNRPAWGTVKITGKIYSASNPIGCATTSDVADNFGTITIKCGSKTLVTKVGKGDIDISFDARAEEVNYFMEPIEISFATNATPVNVGSKCIADLKLAVVNDDMFSYLFKTWDGKKTYRNPGAGEGDATIDLDFYDDVIIDGNSATMKDYIGYAGITKMSIREAQYDALPSSAFVYFTPGRPSGYDYLFSGQDCITFTGRKTSSLPQYPYCNPYTFFRSGWKWRIIATSYDAKLDEYTFTLHHSTTID